MSELFVMLLNTKFMVLSPIYMLQNSKGGIREKLNQKEHLLHNRLSALIDPRSLSPGSDRRSG